MRELSAFVQFSPKTRPAVATQLAEILFAVIAVAIAVSQWLILRSTARGIRHKAAQPTDDGVHRGSAGLTLEWTYAIVPAVALVFLLLFSWRAMHPTAVKVEGVAPTAGMGS
jgi:heme/copper-type cytochrome/quinol oxidase subunit 2